MPLSSMNSRTRSRIPASIGSNQSSKRCEEVSVQSCVASSFVVTLGLAPGSEMARRRRDRWLLIRLAAQNVGRRRLRAIFLGVAVMLGVGIGFAGFIAGWALREGMARSFSRMGADLLVVPRTTLVNITASLLTVQPTDETLPADLAQRISAIPGLARVAPQRIVPALVEGNSATLIAFDPAQDFSVLSWVEAGQGGPGLIAGGALPIRL